MAKQPTLSPSARKIMQEQRRKLKRSSTDAAAARTKRAIDEYERRKQHAAHRSSRTSEAALNAILNSIRSMTSTVASTWGINVPIYLDYGTDLSAWTDFGSIHVTYPRPILRKMYDVDLAKEGIVSLKVDQIKPLLAELRGLVYHEVGHCRFTISYASLTSHVTETQQPVWDALPNTQWAWNVMEDQRMETRVVSESPIIGAYIAAVIDRHFDANSQYLWAFVAGRRFLSPDLRAAAREEFVAQHGEVCAAAVEHAIRRYAAATTEVDMIQAVIDFCQALPVQGDNDNFGRSHRSSGVKQPSAESGATEDDDEPQDGQDSQEGGQEAAGDENGESGDGKGADNGEPDSGAQGDAVTGDGGDNVQGNGTQDGNVRSSTGQGTNSGQSLLDALEIFQQQMSDALQQMSDDAEFDAMIEAATQEAQRVADGALGRVTNRKPISDDMLATAEAVASMMQEAFDVRVADVAPMWEQRTSRGIIDPFAYRTREPGSQDYRRHYNDRGDLGRSMAVSLVLDVSGSMDGYGNELGAAAYAVATACRALDIPITVTAFSSSAVTVFDANDQHIEPHALACNGGTAPSTALVHLEDQRHFKQHHIAIILTDGMWDRSELEALRDSTALVDGMFVLGFRLSEHIMRTFRVATETYSLNSLWDLPMIVQSLVAERLG